MRVLLGVGMKVLVLGLAAGWLSGTVTAAGKDEKASATGTWKSSFTNQNGQTIETTFKLKQDGEKLTGTVTGRDGKDIEIEEGKVKDGDVSFQVTRERDGQKRVFKYTGKLSEDSIKGKVEFERDGETRKRDWEAKRVKE